MVALIIALAGVILLHPVQSGGGNGARDGCRANLKMIALALHNYHDDQGCFPPAYIADDQGRPLHSWRVLLLPYLDQQGLFDEYRFDEPWNGPHNSRLANQVSKIFHCRSDHAKGAPADKRYTSYVAVTGPATVWRGSQPTKLDEVTDGTDKTLMVVEIRNSDIQWLEPRDLSFPDVAAGINNPSKPSISSNHKMGAHAVFVDGHARFLGEDLSAGTLRALPTRAGGEMIGEF